MTTGTAAPASRWLLRVRTDETLLASSEARIEWDSPGIASDVRTAAILFDRGANPTQIVVASGVVTQPGGTAPYTTFGPAEPHSVRLDAALTPAGATGQLTFSWRIFLGGGTSSTLDFPFQVDLVG